LNKISHFAKVSLLRAKTQADPASPETIPTEISCQTGLHSFFQTNREVLSNRALSLPKFDSNSAYNKMVVFVKDIPAFKIWKEAEWGFGRAGCKIPIIR